MTEFLSLNEKTSSRTAEARLGDAGEQLAERCLLRHGYRIIVSNFKVAVGRNSRGAPVTGEIDIIALDGETLCFIEVKTRTSDSFAAPTANVDLRKQRQVTRTARIYRDIFQVAAMPYRFDVVSVVTGGKATPRVDLFKDFWTEAKFRKKAWSGDYF